MSKIFISYNREDGPFIDRLTADLAQVGYETWVDREDIGAGSGWRTSITRAIRSCRAFLLVLSSRSVTSTNVIKELSIADTHRRFIVPLLIDDAEIPPDMEYQLADLQLIDFNEIEYGEGLRRILTALDSAEVADVPIDPTPVGSIESINIPAPKKVARKPARETIVVKGQSRSTRRKAPESGETNWLAVVSLVSAFLGFTFLPGIALPVALITGYMARKQIRSSGGAEKGLGFAQAGIVLGWIGVIVGVLMMCYFSSAMMGY